MFQDLSQIHVRKCKIFEISPLGLIRNLAANCASLANYQSCTIVDLTKFVKLLEISSSKSQITFKLFESACHLSHNSNHLLYLEKHQILVLLPYELDASSPDASWTWCLGFDASWIWIFLDLTFLGPNAWTWIFLDLTPLSTYVFWTRTFLDLEFLGTDVFWSFHQTLVLILPTF